MKDNTTEKIISINDYGNTEEFQSVNNTNFYQGAENKFENVCQKILPYFLSNDENEFLVFKFKYLLCSHAGDARPDLMAISKNLDSFAIVEVETSNHSLQNHVLDQMKRIILCDITDWAYEIYKHLQKYNEDFKFEKDKIINMIHNVPAEYMVVSEKYIPEWEIPLKRIDVEYSSLTIFRDKEQRPQYLYKQSHQFRPKEFKLKLRYVGSDYFEVKSKEYNFLDNNLVYECNFLDNIYTFQVYKKNKKTYLVTKGSWPKTLDIDLEYVLKFEKGIFNIKGVEYET